MSGATGRWLEVEVRSPSAGLRSPLLAEGLVAFGGRAAEERDDWYVTHLPEPDDVPNVVEALRQRLEAISGLDDIEIRTGWRRHEDWAFTWRRGLAPRRITDRIVVRPSWTEAVDLADGDIEIVLDPGMAFGTAEHGTTRGCIRLLDGVVGEGDRVLDVGAGSGILSMTAALLGATDVLAVESDPLACEAMAENIEQNAVADVVRPLECFVDHDWLVSLPAVTGIVANIETGKLRPLLRGFRDAVEPGGWLILSGILDVEVDDLKDEVEALGFRDDLTDTDGEWRSVRFRG